MAPKLTVTFLFTFLAQSNTSHDAKSNSFLSHLYGQLLLWWQQNLKSLAYYACSTLGWALLKTLLSFQKTAGAAFPLSLIDSVTEKKYLITVHNHSSVQLYQWWQHPAFSDEQLSSNCRCSAKSTWCTWWHINRWSGTRQSNSTCETDKSCITRHINLAGKKSRKQKSTTRWSWKRDKRILPTCIVPREEKKERKLGKEKGESW